MKYVCDLWYQQGRDSVEPYGMVFFECSKFPTQKELFELVRNNVSFLKERFIDDTSLTIATPNGRHAFNSVHYVAVKFHVDGVACYLYPTNVRPVVEDEPDNIKLYT